MPTKLLKLSEIVTDAGTQVRAHISEETVEDYAEKMRDATIKFPAVVVFDDGNRMILADGFHRVLAATRNSFLDIEATILKGTRLDALRYALSANSAHGLKRTNEDKRFSANKALVDFPKLSDAELAKMCAVSTFLIQDVRKEIQPLENRGSETRIGADGKERKLPTKKKPAEPMADYHAPRDTRTEAQKTEAVFKGLAESIKEEKKEGPVTLEDLKIAFEKSVQPFWIKAEAKTKKAFVAWLKA
jgi:hypothetical protein